MLLYISTMSEMILGNASFLLSVDLASAEQGLWIILMQPAINQSKMHESRHYRRRGRSVCTFRIERVW